MGPSYWLTMGHRSKTAKLKVDGFRASQLRNFMLRESNKTLNLYLSFFHRNYFYAFMQVSVYTVAFDILKPIPLTDRLGRGNCELASNLVNVTLSDYITSVVEERNPRPATWWCTPLIPTLMRQRQANL